MRRKIEQLPLKERVGRGVSVKRGGSGADQYNTVIHYERTHQDIGKVSASVNKKNLTSCMFHSTMHKGSVNVNICFEIRKRVVAAVNTDRIKYAPLLGDRVHVRESWFVDGWELIQLIVCSITSSSGQLSSDLTTLW